MCIIYIFSFVFYFILFFLYMNVYFTSFKCRIIFVCKFIFLFRRYQVTNKRTWAVFIVKIKLKGRRRTETKQQQHQASKKQIYLLINPWLRLYR